MIANDFRTISGSRSGADALTATRAASATAANMGTISFRWWRFRARQGSVDDEMSADGRDDREHERPAQRPGGHRSASVPARQDGALQRLNATSLSLVDAPLL